MKISTSSRRQPDFRRLFDVVPAPCLALDARLNIVAINEAFAALLAVAPGTLIGRPLTELLPLHPVLFEEPDVLASLERVRVQRCPDTMAEAPARAVGESDAPCIWRAVNTPVLGDTGTLRYILHRLDDITELASCRSQLTQARTLAGELRHRLDQLAVEAMVQTQAQTETLHRLQGAHARLGRLYALLSEFDRFKARLLASANDALRSPLTLVLGTVEHLQGARHLDETVRQALGVAGNHARLLLGRINDLLLQADLDGQRLAARPVRVDLAELVTQVVAPFEGVARQQRVQLIVEAGATAPVQVDPVQTQRIVLAGLANAFQHTPEYGLVRCTVRLDVGAGVACLDIADSGPGIPTDQHERVCDPFRRLDGDVQLRYGGLGLGLTVARDLARLQDGVLALGGATEGGTLFSLRLPLLALDEPDAAHDAWRLDDELTLNVLALFRPPVSPVAATGHWDAPLILVVSAQTELIQLLGRSLGGDYRIVSAGDGRNAWDQAVALRPDLIISEVALPELSGAMLASRARLHDALRCTPVLLLTTQADDAFRQGLLRDQARDYLLKPFAHDELHARVRNLLNLRQLGERNRELNAQLLESHHGLQQAHSALKSANRVLEQFSYPDQAWALASP